MLSQENREQSKKDDKTHTGLGAKYDRIFMEFDEARGHWEYRKLGDKLRQWEKDGEGDSVKHFCRFLIEMFPRRPALIYEMETFLSKQENEDRHKMLNAIRATEEYNRKHPVCPRCGSKKIAKFSYGLPVFDKRLEKNIADGKIVLGGCEVNPFSPKYYCNICKFEFSEKDDYFGNCDLDEEAESTKDFDSLLDDLLLYFNNPDDHDE